MFLDHDLEDEDGVDVQDGEYEFIPGRQETNGRAIGVSRPSTLSSKAGIILVSLPSLPLVCNSLFIHFFYFQRVSTTSLLSFPNSSLLDSRLSYLP